MRTGSLYWGAGMEFLLAHLQKNTANSRTTSGLGVPIILRSIVHEFLFNLHARIF